MGVLDLDRNQARGPILMSSDDNRQYHLDRYYSIRDKAKKYLGGVCVVCGTTESLEFDHIDPSTKLFTIANKMFIPWDALVAELDKCQLLCHHHHKDKHSTQHGSLRMYTNYKCRCDLCRLNWNAHSAEYKKRKRRENKLGNHLMAG